MSRRVTSPENRRIAGGFVRGRESVNRPVTPEVARSSPVAPVKKTCKSAYYVDGVDTAPAHASHTRMRGAGSKRSKTAH
jgi:hypothetical protein